MAHKSFIIKPGVDTNETPVLNQTGISECQLIRFKPDRNGVGLVEKLGGWKQYAKGVIQVQPKVPRHLWSWKDLEGDALLAIGYTGTAASPGNFLAIYEQTVEGEVSAGDITRRAAPTYATSDVVPNFSTTAGSSIVSVVDSTAPTVNVHDVVYIAVRVAVGGIVLFGLYEVLTVTGPGTFTISAKDIFGKPQPATATAANGGVVPAITTTDALSVAVITLPNHGIIAPASFAFLIPVTAGGFTFEGTYDVDRVLTANTFEIRFSQVAAGTMTVPANASKVRLVYSFGGDRTQASIGYGIGGYGEGAYGTGQAVPPTPSTPVDCTDWSLDNWGEILLASPTDAVVNGIPVSGIYYWQPGGGQKSASLIANAPAANDGFFVAMPQRQIVAWGSTFSGAIDPMLVRWCDVGNFDVWAGTVANQAGSFRLPKGSKIVGGLQTPQQGLLWTDLGVWSMQYISQPYIYSFNEVGSGCGLIARKAAGVLNGGVYWMSQAQFFTLGGGGATAIPCPVWDIVFQDLDMKNRDKIRFAANSMFNEVAWYYPSLSSPDGENDSYVKFHTLLNAWDYGKLTRSCWLNQSILGPPIGGDATGRIYQHEVSTEADTLPMESWFKSGFFCMTDADSKLFVDEIWPDMKWGYQGGQKAATVNVTFHVKDFPTEDAFPIGPFAMNTTTKFLSPRIRGRLLQIELRSTDTASFWRIGGMRYRGSQDGRY
jgi:hypothetical protein